MAHPSHHAGRWVAVAVFVLALYYFRAQISAWLSKVDAIAAGAKTTAAAPANPAAATVPTTSSASAMPDLPDPTTPTMPLTVFAADGPDVNQNVIDRYNAATDPRYDASSDTFNKLGSNPNAEFESAFAGVGGPGGISLTPISQGWQFLTGFHGIK